MSGGDASRMSTLETKQEALEGKMSEVIQTTAANTKALQELQLIFKRCMSRFKDNSEGSPSVSKSAVDSDVAAGVQGIQRPATCEVARSKGTDTDDVDNLDFDSGSDTPTQGKAADVAVGVETVTRRPSPAAAPVPRVPAQSSMDVQQEEALSARKSKALETKVDLTVPKKDVLQEEALSKGRAVAAAAVKDTKTKEDSALKASVKDVQAKKTSREHLVTSGEGGSSEGGMLHAANKLLEASKMAGDSVPTATPAGASTKPGKKHRQASPPKVDAPAADIEEASTQVSNDALSGPRKSLLEVQKSKLLVINVHGTLLDCSLIDEPNPNAGIRYSMKTASRRVVCRPWLAKFLSNCFLHFEVAF